MTSEFSTQIAAATDNATLLTYLADVATDTTLGSPEKEELQTAIADRFKTLHPTTAYTHKPRW